MLHVALGDSITYGYSASEDNRAYVRRLENALSRQEKAHVFVEARPGWTSTRLLKAVKRVQPAVWDEAKIVTLLIGGNDLLRRAPWLWNGGDAQILKVADTLHQNITDIVSIAKRPHHRFVIGTVYNPFPNSLRAEEFTTYVNRCIRRVARRNGLWVADIQRAFSGHEKQYIEGYKEGLLKDMKLISNPIHPNDAGHAAIARVFLRACLQKKRVQKRKPTIRSASATR